MAPAPRPPACTWPNWRAKTSPADRHRARRAGPGTAGRARRTVDRADRARHRHQQPRRRLDADRGLWLERGGRPERPYQQHHRHGRILRRHRPIAAPARPGGVEGGAAPLTRQVMSDLHMVKFGGLAMKWLYFVCGLAGSAMMGTGAVLFMVKRRNRMGDEFGAATARVYRLIEGLNVAALAGLAIACVAYLWANRLLPVSLPQRAGWELRAFFIVWALTLAHAWLCSPRRAWLWQLGLLSALCLLLPLLSLMTLGDHPLAQIARGDWESAGVELTAVAIGVAAGWAALRLGRKPLSAPPPRDTRASREATA
ncbi:PepSY-associated TM helix domain-containing protein [Achromobacter xylosoxidans]